MRTSKRQRLRLERLETRLAPAFGAIGPEFRINSFTTGDQDLAQVASDADGDLVVVWQSLGQDGGNLGIYGQRYSSSGTALGSEFRVNTVTTGQQGRPAVAVSAGGDFVVVWESENQDGNGFGVFGQRYNSVGAPLGGEFRVNEFTTGAQADARVAVDADGDFVVAWRSTGQDGSGDGVFARRYDAAGTPMGGELRVNTFTTAAQSNPALAVDADGDFIVAWASFGQDGNGNGIYAQRYNAAGAAQGVEFRVNDTTASNQQAPSVAMSASGDFVVAWQSNYQDASFNTVVAKRYSAAGIQLAGEFQVNTFTTGIQDRPAVSVDAAGDFVIAWTSASQDGNSDAIIARRFTAAGTAIGGEFQINTITTDSQNKPAVAADADGDFVVVWQSAGQDGGGNGIFAQRYSDLDNNGDTAGPAVAVVTPSGAPNALRPGVRLNGSVSGFVVSFTEDMSVAGGSGGAGSATNLANYRLTRNGVNVSSLISGVVYGYNPGTNRYESAVSLSTPIADGSYTLTLRNTLTDVPGNRLDGRGDAPGFATDFALSFTIAGAAPAGAQLRVNTFTTGTQTRPNVAMDAAGNYVVTWESTLQDGSAIGVYAQRYNAAGVPQGPEFRVNTFTTGNQLGPRAAISATGDFIITWRSANQDGNSYGVYAQRYSAAGVPMGTEFRVNTTTSSGQGGPAVAMNAAGDFVVAWQSFLQDGSGYGIYAQRFAASGATRGGEFRVSTFTSAGQDSPAVAIDAKGNFVVAWESDDQDGGGDGIFAQRFSSDGSPLGAEFAVNSTTENDQSAPSVASDSAGNFVIAWTSDEQDGSQEGVFAQRYGADGAAQGGELSVNAFTTGVQSDPRVAMNAAGDFVVTWTSSGQDGDATGVYLRRFSAAAAPSGAEVRVNSFTTGNQQFQAIAMTAGGDFIVAWISPQDGGGTGIYHQRFTRPVSVESVRPNSGTTPMAPNGILVAPVSQVVVQFSGPLVTAGGGSVTSVANWQLSRNGIPVAGAISTITPGPNQATLTFSTPLNDGRYTLTALPSILDLDGRALDGDFDGTPGGAFVLTFDVKPVLARGPETLVNTVTAGAQDFVSVAADAAGNYVVVWTSNGQDGGGDGIYAQRYSANGVAQGAEFRVNQFTTGNQRIPAVAASPAGDFIVVWSSDGQDGSNDGVFARRYSAAGAALGDEFRVNTFTTNVQANPTISMDATGDFVVAWESNLQDGSGYGVFAQRYSSAGVPLGAEFRVNTTTFSGQRSPAVAMNPAGDFVVAWQSNAQDGNSYGIFARRFSAAGSALSGEIAVNQFTTGGQAVPTVGMDGTGQFVITWGSVGQDGGLTGVYGRRFSTAGTPVAGEFRVNTQTVNIQTNPSIAMNPVGDFVIAWDSLAQDGSNQGVFAQRYNPDATIVGGEFRVNTVTTNAQLRPAVAIDAVGDFVVAWSSNGQDGAGYGIYHQRYVANLTPTTSGLPNITIPPSPTTSVNLAAGFNDIEDGAASLTYTVVGNSNPGLFASVTVVGTMLELIPAALPGMSLLTIRATDSGGSFVETSFTVTVSGATPPQVAQTQVNGGAVQRSRVTELTVTFSSLVTFNAAVADAFTLARNGGGAVAFSATANVVGGVTVVTINNFTGAEAESGSLRDGRYTLITRATQISAGGLQLDGNGDGTGGDDFTFGDAQGLFRFYGDMTGDRRVDIADFGFFSLAYLTPANYNAALDFNNDGRIDIADFGQFSVRYFTTLP